MKSPNTEYKHNIQLTINHDVSLWILPKTANGISAQNIAPIEEYDSN